MAHVRNLTRRQFDDLEDSDSYHQSNPPIIKHGWTIPKLNGALNWESHLQMVNLQLQGGCIAAGYYFDKHQHLAVPNQ